VVVRRGGGVAEILETAPGKTAGGMAMETDDPEEWAKILGKLLRSKALMAKFRRESRKMSLRFGLDPWVENHLVWYRNLLESRTPDR
jgi:hypothetical protein